MQIIAISRYEPAFVGLHCNKLILYRLLSATSPSRTGSRELHKLSWSGFVICTCLGVSAFSNLQLRLAFLLGKLLQTAAIVLWYTIKTAAAVSQLWVCPSHVYWYCNSTWKQWNTSCFLIFKVQYPAQRWSLGIYTFLMWHSTYPIHLNIHVLLWTLSLQ